MLNGYFEPAIGNGKVYQPYITFGVGWSGVRADFTLVTEQRYWGPPNNDPPSVIYDTGYGTFAYQVGAGVGYEINEKITLDCMYRFKWVGDNLHFGTTEVEYNSHNLLFGVRYTF